MTQYLNANGLVDGRIPTGQACPFLSKCNFKTNNCPGSDNGMKPNDFSCAAARLHSLIASNKDCKLPLLEKVLESGFAPPHSRSNDEEDEDA